MPNNGTIIVHSDKPCCKCEECIHVCKIHNFWS